MDIFGILSMIGGLALFLYGMEAMGAGLSKLSGGRMERLLEKLTSKRIMAVLLGAGVTAVIQSSSATTVMVVGFVNSGIMKLNQAVGIIMGANIGTTITSWLLSLTGIQGSSFILKMLKPSSFSPILAIVGIIFIMFTKDEKKKDIGGIFQVVFDEEGNLEFRTSSDENDLLYDEIGCGLKIRELQRTKEELLRALEMYYKVLYIGMDESEM